MGAGGGQTTLDDISRRHKLSYEIKIVEIDLVVGAGEFLQGLPIDNEQRRSVFFDFVRKWRREGGQTTIYDISRRHSLSNEKNVKIGQVIGADELSEVLPYYFKYIDLNSSVRMAC
ncbi:hypothetical protein AVEN_263104-1 [Araneus ventricosus]|uniref:Uncharacterized protein n=1 Tax=Araneus ventricosus TaxID=182803 RepID=A0A4Y2TG11_ARAVE|nr:hypothetical protein AVEN_263104-1 [Araneus ventricosus]